MSAIEQITVTCHEQEDVTGDDDLDFYLNGAFLGRLTISTGETRKVIGPGMLFGDTIFVSAGDTLEIKEADALDPDDPVLKRTITDADIDAPVITLKDTLSSADYTFEFRFVRF